MSVKWYGDKIESEADDLLKKSLLVSAIQVQGKSKQLLTDYPAVDTGRLRNSITYKIGIDNATIGTNVEYAPYVEFGTVKMKPRSYLRRALDEERKSIIDIFQKYFKVL